MVFNPHHHRLLLLLLLRLYPGGEGHAAEVHEVAPPPRCRDTTLGAALIISLLYIVAPPRARVHMLTQEVSTISQLSKRRPAYR